MPYYSELFNVKTIKSFKQDRKDNAGYKTQLVEFVSFEHISKKHISKGW